jgi:hypothetical protein
VAPNVVMAGQRLKQRKRELALQFRSLPKSQPQTRISG